MTDATQTPQTPASDTHAKSSHAQILRSSSIVGGAQAINYIIGLIRTKIVAVLLGPSGVGLVGLYISIVGLTGTIAQLGIDQSGVREIASAAGTGDRLRIAAAAKSLQRACWVTGLLGWILTAILAWPLTQWAFGATEHVWAVAILGVVVLFEAVANGQKAVLQGLRHIGDLARLQIVSALLTTVVAVGVYAWLRDDGILPVIIITGVLQVGCAYFFAGRVNVQNVAQTWAETWRNFQMLFKLGAALMYGTVIAAVVGFAIRALVVRDLGLEAAGLYQAAWMLSGMFGAFVLQAMATDFYPRLAGVAEDNATVNNLVNDQIEVGMLLALPGVIGAMAFAPFLMQVFYSDRFTEAAMLMPWFVAGVFGQVLSWPLGMVQQAKAASGWLYFSRTHGALVQLGAVVGSMYLFGLLGTAVGFCVYVYIQGLLAFVIALRLSKFRPNASVMRLLLYCSGAILLTVVLNIFVPAPWSHVLTGGVCALVAFEAAKALRSKLPHGNRIGRLLGRLLPKSVNQH